MPVILKPRDEDKAFASTTIDKIILNDLNFASIEDNELLSKHLETVYQDNAVEIRPHCACKELTGSQFLGAQCPSCLCTVVSPFDKYESNLWLKTLHPDLRFISTDYWNRVRLWISSDPNIDILRWIVDKRYNSSKLSKGTISTILGTIKSLPNFERSYTWLLNNMVQLMVAIENLPNFKNKRDASKILKSLWNTKNAQVTSTYLPVLSSRYFILEKSKKGKITPVSRGLLLDSLKQFIYSANEDRNFQQISNQMGKTVASLADFYYKEFKQVASGKAGLFRKNIYGTRSHFTARGVIIPFFGKHRHDEIHLPYKMAVTLLRMHIFNRLLKSGMSHKEIDKKLWQGVNKFDQELYNIMLQLIEETDGGKGIPCLVTRNPSQKIGSTYLLYVTFIKLDIGDNTINYSSLIVKAPNADYDGDSLNVTLLTDKRLEKMFHRVRVAASVPDDSKPFTVSSNVNLGGQIFNLQTYMNKKVDREVTIPSKWQ